MFKSTKSVNYAKTISSSEISSTSSLRGEFSEVSQPTDSGEVVIIEPFYGGSHKQLIDTIEIYFQDKTKIQKFTLPDKKWPWRARTSALYFSNIIPKSPKCRVLLCSSVLNLAEFIALRRDFSGVLKIIYFHENQLIYPIRKQKDRDFQFGYNQILSALVADVIFFNSFYNMNSFITKINSFLNFIPDLHIKITTSDIVLKCKVIYFPVTTPALSNVKENILHIIWPHRWEHDKNPELFFQTLFKLKQENFKFKVSVLGQTYQEIPDIFLKAKEELKDEIIQFGTVESKEKYYEILSSGHVVVSTALHEFFGVAVMEATLLGCFPIVCNALVYPEFYPPDCLYKTPNQLLTKLKNLCEKPYLADVYLKKCNINFENFNVSTVMKYFEFYFLNHTIG